MRRDWLETLDSLGHRELLDLSDLLVSPEIPDCRDFLVRPEESDLRDFPEVPGMLERRVPRVLLDLRGGREPLAHRGVTGDWDPRELPASRVRLVVSVCPDSPDLSDRRVRAEVLDRLGRRVLLDQTEVPVQREHPDLVDRVDLLVHRERLVRQGLKDPRVTLDLRDPTATQGRQDLSGGPAHRDLKERVDSLEFRDQLDSPALRELQVLLVPLDPLVLLAVPDLPVESDFQGRADRPARPEPRAARELLGDRERWDFRVPRDRWDPREPWDLPVLLALLVRWDSRGARAHRDNQDLRVIRDPRAPLVHRDLPDLKDH